MADDGRLIIEVPNADDVLLNLYGNDAFADFTYWICHLFLFDMQTIKAVTNKAGFEVAFLTQVQRYPLANHLYWLSKGNPGGHMKWSALREERMDNLYGDLLIKHGVADTIIVELKKL